MLRLQTRKITGGPTCPKWVCQNFSKGVRRSNEKPIEKSWGWPSTGIQWEVFELCATLGFIHFFGALSGIWDSYAKPLGDPKLFVGHRPKVVSACERAEQWAWALAIVDQLWKKAFDFMEDIYTCWSSEIWNPNSEGGLVDDFLVSEVSWLQGVCFEGGVSVGSFGNHCPGSKGQDGACGFASFCPKDLDSLQWVQVRV